MKAGLKFASGNPISAEDAAWSLQRAVILNKTPGFILTQFGFTPDNVKESIRATDPKTGQADWEIVMEVFDSKKPKSLFSAKNANKMVAALGGRQDGRDRR